MDNAFQNNPRDSRWQQHAPNHAPAGKLRLLRLLGACIVVLFLGRPETTEPPPNRPKSGEFRFRRVVFEFCIIMLVSAIHLALVWYFFTAREQRQQQEK